MSTWRIPLDPSLLIGAMRQQLGLSLKSQDAVVDFMVIDSAERVMAGNESKRGKRWMRAHAPRAGAIDLVSTGRPVFHQAEDTRRDKFRCGTHECVPYTSARIRNPLHEPAPHEPRKSRLVRGCGRWPAHLMLSATYFQVCLSRNTITGRSGCTFTTSLPSRTDMFADSVLSGHVGAARDPHLDPIPSGRGALSSFAVRCE